MLVDGFGELYVQAETLRAEKSHSTQLAIEFQSESHREISFHETRRVDACLKCFFLVLDVTVPCIGSASRTWVVPSDASTWRERLLKRFPELDLQTLSGTFCLNSKILPEDVPVSSLHNRIVRLREYPLPGGMPLPNFAAWRKPELMAQAKDLGVKTRKESIKANGAKHRTWRPSAEVAVECALEWQKRFPAPAAVPPDEDAVGNSGAASSSFDPGGNHSGEEGLTCSIHEQCRLRHVPYSIACLTVVDLRKACHAAGVATKSWVQSADGRKHRVHVSKEMLQRKLAAKETVQESAPASADAPESSCASDYDKTSGRQNRTLPCSPGSGFAKSFSQDCAETSVIGLLVRSEERHQEPN